MRLMVSIAEIFTLPFVFLAVWAPELFAYVFGSEWRTAGQYASLLVPPTFCLLFTSWPERIYEVAQKQHVSFLIQVGFDSVRVAFIWTLLHLEAPPCFCVLVSSLIACVSNLVYLIGIFKIAGFRLYGLYVLSKTVGIQAGAFSIFLYLLTLAISSTGLRFVLGSVMLAVYLSGWIFFKARRLTGVYSAANMELG
jgi:O-antigen/teichoic acid export membrane protein